LVVGRRQRHLTAKDAKKGRKDREAILFSIPELLCLRVMVMARGAIAGSYSGSRAHFASFARIFAIFADKGFYRPFGLEQDSRHLLGVFANDQRPT